MNRKVEKAVKALVAFEAANGKGAKPATSKVTDLLSSEDGDLEADPSDRKFFWLTVNTKKMPNSLKLKPVKIAIQNSFAPESAEVCLFTKDPQKEFKALLESNDITVDKVIGVSKLKANYYSYESKRKLCDSYDLFLTDDRIISLLPPLIGKAFFSKKKQPIPVDLTAKNLKSEIEAAKNATYLHLNKGLCNAVKIGTTKQTVAQVVDNIIYSVDKIVDKVPSKWSNVQSIQLKLSDSASLPLFNALPVADEDNDAQMEEAEATKLEVATKKDATVKKSVEAKKKASAPPAAATKVPAKPAISSIKSGRVGKKTKK
ncbi:ribosomal protein L1p/L10e family-domain-containing protein [Chytriomyces sp. MP71]|nr:ribosomal protein L1p/L10e family-domain-containing protein [Chytriomyces sp. MP71]